MIGAFCYDQTEPALMLLMWRFVDHVTSANIAADQSDCPNRVAIIWLHPVDKHLGFRGWAFIDVLIILTGIYQNVCSRCWRTSVRGRLRVGVSRDRASTMGAHTDKAVMITDGESRDTGTRTLETAQLDRTEAVLQ